MSSSPHPTHRDFDVAQMARQALFPKQINRDGSHTTLFPAVEALTRIRDNAMAWDPNRAPSSFFPKGIVVVREIGHEALKWNGQPEIEDTKASFDVIPNMLSVKCMECAELVPKTVQAFVSSSSSGNEHQEIVLCSDRLVKKDYKASATGELLDVPPRSYAAVEEALAHQLTLAGIKLENNRNDGVKDTTTCPEMAASHVKAARAAECYFNKNGREVKRGSCLPLGYSLLPPSMQTKLMNRCISSVATRAVAEKYGDEKAKQCVEQAMGAS